MKRMRAFKIVVVVMVAVLLLTAFAIAHYRIM